MEEYTEILEQYLGGKRNYSKTMFKLMGRIYRRVNKGKLTWDEVIKTIEKK